MNPQIYFNEVNERQGVFHRRAFLMGGVAGVGLVTLAGRLAYLQLVEADKYKTLSLNNEFESRLQPPPRGLILDRNGIVLASNRPDFRLYVSRDENSDVDLLLDRLQKLVPLDDDHRNRVLQDLVDAPRRAPVTVMEDLTWEEFSRINVRDARAARRHRRHGRHPRLSVLGRLRPRDRLRGQGLQGRRHQGRPELRPDPAQSGLPDRQGGDREDLRPADARQAGGQEGRGRRQGPRGARGPRRRRALDRRPGAAADPRRRHPEPRAGGVRGRLRRGGDDGLPHRRRALHALGAQFRRQPLRQGADRARVPGARRLRPQAAAQQDRHRHLSARLDLQDHGGADGAGDGHPAQHPVHLQQGLESGAGGSGTATTRTARWT